MGFFCIGGFILKYYKLFCIFQSNFFSFHCFIYDEVDKVWKVLSTLPRSHPAPSGPVVSHITPISPIHLFIHFICQTFSKTSFLSITKPDPRNSQNDWDKISCFWISKQHKCPPKYPNVPVSSGNESQICPVTGSHLREPQALMWDYEEKSGEGVRRSGLKEASGRWLEVVWSRGEGCRPISRLPSASQISLPWTHTTWSKLLHPSCSASWAVKWVKWSFSAVKIVSDNI